MLIEEVLSETLRFETLVTELSAEFANLSPNEVDREIDKWLKTLVEFLGVDRASFFQFEEDWTTLYRSHSYTIPGIESLPPPPIGMKDQFSWVTDQLRRGVTVKWSRILDDMPEEAVREKEYAAKLGVKSGLNIPVRMGGSVICAITFTSIATYRDWPDAMVARLHLIGEIFAAAVERKRAEALLQAKETERKQGEQSQRESQLKYEALVQSINGIVWEADPQTFTFTFVSKQAERILGYPLEQWFEGPNFWPDHMHQDDRDWVVKYCVDATARGEDHQFEYRMIAADGRVVWLNDIVSLHIAADRSVILRGLMVDITERKRAEAKLQESEGRFRQLSEAPFEAIILHENGTILESNQSFSRLYGYERAEVIGKSVLDLTLPELREPLLQRVRSAGADPFEGLALRKDGTTFRAELAAKPIHYQGRVVRVAAIRDITEQKQNERRQAAQYAVTRVLAESATLAAAVPQLLQVICESLRWKMGEFWRVCDRVNLLRCVETWQVPALDATSFIEASRQVEFAPGAGLAGRVWQGGQPVGIPDVMTDVGFERTELAASVGLRGAVAFPILLENQTLGVMMFFSRRVMEVDEDLLKVMSAIGSQIGQFTERKRAEEALRESEERFRQIAENVQDVIWMVDANVERLLYVNPAYEKIWGASSASLYQDMRAFTEPVHPDDREIVVRMLEEQKMRNRVPFEYRIIRPDGAISWIRDRSFPVRNAEGEVYRIAGVAEDITESKQAEEKLRQSETQMAEAQRLAKVGSWNWDIRNNIHTWSDELYHMYGLDPQESEPSYDTFIELVHPDDRAATNAVIEHALNAQESINSYLRIIRPDGVERIFHSRGNTISDSSGTPIRMYGTVQDVTERKQAEEAQREAEQKYRDIFENAGEGIFQSTPDGRFIGANPALARMHGFASPEELIHSRLDISRQIYVDSTRREEFKHQIEQQGALRGFEHEVFRKDGSKFWISVNAHAVRDEEGAIQYYEGTAQDISERKAAEGKLKATNEQLRALSASLQFAREEEGTRIARELHDEMGSSLTTLRWGLDDIDSLLAALALEVDTDRLREKIATMTTLAEGTLHTVRRISLELRPGILDDLGLMAAIDWEAQQFQARSGMVCHFDSSVERIHLTRTHSTAIFRIFQEALTNVRRHATATRVDVALMEGEGELVLTIRDNGRGITDEEKSGTHSLGLLGMRERAVLFGGEVDITGVENQGTVVTVRIPS